ncbi:MAG TPA: amino acid permease [Thermoleophilaceae bacterium]|nr:amino acid permease [Thermoleophilaceae bacterium]
MPERRRGFLGRSGRSDAGLARTLGVPALFAMVGAAIGSSIYFALGVVARNALELTPLAFLVAGAFFAVTAMTYVEGNSLHPERGGASTFARYAFDELWSFVVGWAILLDYQIVIAIGALSISHYLAAFWPPLGGPGVELAVAALALAVVVRWNVRGLAAGGLGRVLRVQLLNFALLLAVIVVGGLVAWREPGLAGSTALELTPTLGGFVFAATVASAGLTGIEAASGLAGEIRPRARELRRAVATAAVAVVLLFVGVSVVALAGATAAGEASVLGRRYFEAPVLGVVAGFEPAWLAEAAGYVVGAVAAVVLFVAVNAFMLGFSRLVYSLATNRQVPMAIGRLHGRHGTPGVAIAAAGAIALVLVATMNLRLLLSLFAFGAMLSFLLAHVSVIVLRFREPDLRRPFRVPLSVKVRGASVPLPAVLGALIATVAWVNLIVSSQRARIAGAVWMAAGLMLYLVYRRRQGESLRARLAVAPGALQEAGPVQYGSLLVPIFGRSLDDDIVGTAGRLAAEEARPDEGGTLIEALYVFEIPMALPLDAELDEERLAAARRALARAKEVGEEYDGVEVATATVRARATGAAIVEEARRRGVEAIVLAAEEPTRIRGGAVLGGRGGARQRFVGDVTREVLEHAPCRVIATAPPAEEAPDGREATPSAPR